MKKILINGHQNFGNRGCEALVRSLVTLLRLKFGAVTIYVPSSNPKLDAQQYRNYKEDGIVFVPFVYPLRLKLWIQFQRLPFTRLRSWYPRIPLPHNFESILKNVDFAVSIGGDMYTYEGRGRLPTWILWLDSLMIERNIDVYLISASLSDFSQIKGYSNYLKSHLRRFAGIAVRELISFKIATENFGLRQTILIPDIAFLLPQKPIDVSKFWPKIIGNGLIGINLSPLVERLSLKKGMDAPTSTIKRFITHLINTSNYSILLIPHVSALDGSLYNNDYKFLYKIFDQLGDFNGRLQIMDGRLNAVQTKYVISKCRFFIGTRLHSVIAALSSKVPTISLSYSNKGPGIISQVFENDRWSLFLANLTFDHLTVKFDALCESEDDVKTHLAEKILSLEEILEEKVHALF